jgi:hypothetical protein
MKLKKKEFTNLR